MGDCLVNDIPTLRCIPDIFQALVTWALIFSGAVAVFFIVFSGFKYISSGGDPKQTQGAQQTLTWAVVGLLVILFSFFIINFIADITNVGCIKKFGFDSCQPEGFPTN